MSRIAQANHSPSTNPSVGSTAAGRPALLLGAVALLLAACGGGGAGSAPPSESAQGGPTGRLEGTVAVGAPMTDGKLRILDATGAVVASGIMVAADGSYEVPSLSGTAPFRIEACGYTGPNYQCIYSVAQGPGKANVTPLTTATVLLASGKTPEQMMVGVAEGLSNTAVDGAQIQLRQSLAGVLAGNVPANFDFVAGNLAAGSRSGYDKVLDSVGVNTGIDGQPFVQITPRLGQGNLYLQQGNTVGSVSVDAAAGNLSLTGLEGLFRSMTAAVAGANACADPANGMASLMAADARLEIEDGALNGAAAVGAGICQFFAQDNKWGARLLSPTLGRCDLSGAAPLCHISFVMQSVTGEVEAVGSRMGVTQENGAWKFLGDLDGVHIDIFATAQRDRRIDGATPVDSYTRAVSFGIPALPGLACARVVQRDASQQAVPVAYFKPYAGAQSLRRLSLWRSNAQGNDRSLDAATGALRSSDDTWLTLPQGSEGDAVVRNFLRGGRSVTVSLFSDGACTTAMQVGGRSEFEVDVQGVPPVWASMAGLPWIELTSAASQALKDLSLAANASGSYAFAWTAPQGPLGVNGASFCGDRSQCGEGQSGRIGTARLRPSDRSATINLNNGTQAVQAGSNKMLAVYGRNGDGMLLQNSFLSCPAVPSGQPCN